MSEARCPQGNAMTAPPVTPTPEHVEEWVKDAGLDWHKGFAIDEDVNRYTKLATLAAAWGAKQEREACAKVCEELWPEMHKYWGAGQAKAACTDCASAIRARDAGDKE